MKTKQKLKQTPKTRTQLGTEKTRKGEKETTPKRRDLN